MNILFIKEFISRFRFVLVGIPTVGIYHYMVLINENKKSKEIRRLNYLLKKHELDIKKKELDILFNDIKIKENQLLHNKYGI